MKTSKRGEKRPLLEYQRYHSDKSTTTLLTAPETKSHWKLWIAVVSGLVALGFIAFALMTNSDRISHSHNSNSMEADVSSDSSDSSSLSDSGDYTIETTSYLNDDTVAEIKSDSGLSSAAKFDLITYLPGLSVDINDLGYHMFAGYVDVDPNLGDDVSSDITKQLFYWFFTADCDDPDDQPLILWTNGGPGEIYYLHIFSKIMKFHSARSTQSTPSSIVTSPQATSQFRNNAFVFCLFWCGKREWSWLDQCFVLIFSKSYIFLLVFLLLLSVEKKTNKQNHQRMFRYGCIDDRTWTIVGE